MKREKRRYLAIELEYDGALSKKELSDAIWNSVTRLYGEYGASLTNLVLINYDEQKSTAVIRTSLTGLGMVRTALGLITSLLNREAAIHVTAVSGTIKGLSKSNKTNQ